jgi:hypothetical protein
MSLYNSPATNCQCNSDIQQLGFRSPYKNLQLAAICDYHEVLRGSGGKEIHGKFFFRGKQTFSGTLSRHYNDAMGIEVLTFRGEKLMSKNPLYGDFVDLRFEDIEHAAKHFRTPPLTTEHPCLEAEITFNATEILAIPGDSDEAGNYVRGYTSVKNGEYKSCKGAS